MPKVVVNLSKIGQDIDFLEKLMEKHKSSMEEAGYILITHSIDNEIKYLKDFKNSLELSITRKQSEILQERVKTNNKEICDLVKESGEKALFTDKYANTFQSLDFYNYVELTYGDYKRFKEMRFLGNSFGFPLRFYMENVKHDISPTTLKLFENIHKIKEENLDWGIQKVINIIAKSKENCDRALRGEETSLDWRHFFNNYFHSPVKYEKKDSAKLPKFEYKAKFDSEELRKYNNEIESNKFIIETLLKRTRQQTKANPQAASPATGTAQDTDKPKIQIPKCDDKKSSGILDNLSKLSENVIKNQERQLENFRRRFNYNCIIKEVIECTLPPNLDFCDFIFKDISVSGYYQKLSLLKTAGLGDLYLQIERSIEDNSGISQLREADKTIKNLERLIQEEADILDRLNRAKEEYDEKMSSLVEELQPLTDQLAIVNANIDIATTQNQISRLNRQKSSLLARISRIRQRIDLLRQQNETLPQRIETLSTNYDEHISEKGRLVRDFGDKIAENKFNERQAELISQGKNFEAVLLQPNEDEKWSTESISTVIINAIDSVIPLENLCKLLFSLILNSDYNLNLKLPENLLESFATKVKDPFGSLSVDFGKLLQALIFSFIMNIIDSLLKNLCEGIGNFVISNTLNGGKAFDDLGQNFNKIVDGTFLSEQLTTGSAMLTTGSATIAADAVTLAVNKLSEPNITSKVFSLFVEGGSSPFAEWDISPDRKSFVIRNPPIIDFSQIEKFAQSAIVEFLGDYTSPQAFLDMLGGEKGSEVAVEEPSEERGALTVDTARAELNCLMSRATSILSPSETISLLTKKPDQNTRNLVNRLAEICAPTMLSSYPGDSLVELVGELGILAGSLEIEEKLEGINDLENLSPTTEKILCERYDNTSAFRTSLLSRTIDPQLASEILDEVQQKKLEEVSYITDSLSQIVDNKILEKPQTAKQFYLEAISQALEMQEKGVTPKSLSDLKLQKQNKNSIDIKQIIEEKISEETENNAALQTMFELTSESLIRPYRDRFRRDSENYLKSISLEMPYEKEISAKQIVNNVEVPNMEYLNIVNMGYVPAIKIKSGDITINSPSILRTQTEIITLNETKKQEILNRFLQTKNEFTEDAYNLALSAIVAFLPAGSILLAIQSIINIFGANVKLSDILGSLDDGIQQYFEEQFLSDTQENLDSEYKYVKTDLEKEITRQHVNEFKDNNYSNINSYKEKTNTYNSIWFSDNNLKDLLNSISNIKFYENQKIFQINGVDVSSLEFKLLPKHALPVSKKVGEKTVLMSKEPDFDFLRDVSQPYEIQNIQSKFPPFIDFYISNGFVEDNYLDNFLEAEDYQKNKNSILDKKQEIGQKFIEAVELFENNLNAQLTGDTFQITISSKHSENITNPLLSNKELFGINNQSIDYDSVSSEKLSKESIDCAVRQITQSSFLHQNILGNIGTKVSLERQILESIPLWKISYNEIFDDQNATSDMSLKTSGLAFQPTGMYDNFYHDTAIKQQSVISEEVSASLINSFQRIPHRFDAFMRLLGISTNKEVQEVQQFALVSSFSLPEMSSLEIYQSLFSTVQAGFLSSLRQSRLLEKYENTDKKLIEFFDFTREQTNYEKENDLDPNIMDFVSIKKQFLSLYNSSTDEELTNEQIKGEQSSENKATKAAKNILLISFVRLCIVEFILKNIFIMDSYNYNKSLSELDFVIQDLSNFVCQESKRVGIGQEIQKQSIKYYDLILKSDDKEAEKQLDRKVVKWQKENSFSSTVSNPKMVKVVKNEFLNSLNKFNALLGCGDKDDSVDEITSKVLDVFAKKENDQTPGAILKIEKYVKVPKLTALGESSLSTTTIQKIKDMYEKEITTSQLNSLLRNTNIPLDRIYDCDSAQNLFESPFIFGAKIVIKSTGNQKEFSYNLGFEESGIDFSQEDIGNVNKLYDFIYKNKIYPKLTTNKNLQILIKYCLGVNELLQMLLLHCFLYSNDQEARFLFEGTKLSIAKMYAANMKSGDIKAAISGINSMLEIQKSNEDNTGNPLGPSLEALKFFYRTPIQILKGQATLVDPNIALSDVIVRGAAMAGMLSGQQIDIPYSLASLALLPFPLFNGVAPPIPPLTSYNIAMPVGPIFLGLEPLLRDLPYYDNKDKGKLPTGNGNQNSYNNPLFCELSDEENGED